MDLEQKIAKVIADSDRAGGFAIDMARSVLSCIEEEGMVVVPKDRLIHLGRLAKVLPEDCLAYAAISR